MAKDVKTTEFGAKIPEQVDIMTNIAASMGSGHWPDLTGEFPKKPNKKDVIGYLLFKGTMELFESLGVIEAVKRTVENMTGEKFDESLYGSNGSESTEEVVVPAGSVLEGLEVTKSES